jgi:hypothetical protein
MNKHYNERLICSIGIEVFTEVVMKNFIFWNIALYPTVEINKRFGGRRFFHLQF